MKRISLLVLFLFSVWVTATPAQQSGPWKGVDDAMGRQGQDQPDGAHRFAMPRSDLKVTANGVEIKPGFALGSWAAFQMMGNHSDVMGDLVLTETEVGPVMQKLVDSGIEITALHNHLLNESPHIMYLHIQARGRASVIAEAVHSALQLTGTPPPSPSTGQSNETPSLDTAQIRAALGYSGSVNSGVFQVSVPRGEAVHAGDMEVPPAMGVATAINFQPTGAGKAAVTGDFVLTASEVAPVIQALRTGGIEITAVHSHMLTEEPRLSFVRYWADADAVGLARALRSALDRMNVKKAAS
jgi:biotin operon repressor